MWDGDLEWHNGHWADPDETNSWVSSAIAGPALLGLGVAWLRDNSNSSVDTPMSFAKASGRPYLANVYAAIAEIKRSAK